MTWIISAACAVGTLLLVALIIGLYIWLWGQYMESYFWFGVIVIIIAIALTFGWHYELFG